jgi:dolichyl-phosphate-mannose--protein O-mannosyl transferase
MHFSLSRIATLDIFVAFFILLMYYLFWKWMERGQGDGRLTTAPTDDGNFIDRNGQLGGSVWLGLCGVAMGVAVAIKWTGVFAGLGLGALFLWHIISQRKRLFSNGKQFWRLIGFCLVFFVAVPVLIYVLSYIPFVSDPPSANPLKKALDNTVDIFTMHSTREEEILYTSPAYSWPIMWMPTLFANITRGASQVTPVICMGNPLIWWGGIPCLLFCLYRFLRKKDAKAGFLVVAYLAQYLPWFFFLNVKFLYHYFPAVLFTILMMGYVFDLLLSWKPWGRKAVVGFLALAVVVFFIFYPIISGYPVSMEYVFSLRLINGWFPDWWF